MTALPMSYMVSCAQVPTQPTLPVHHHVVESLTLLVFGSWNIEKHMRAQRHIEKSSGQQRTLPFYEFALDGASRSRSMTGKFLRRFRLRHCNTGIRRHRAQSESATNHQETIESPSTCQLSFKCACCLNLHPMRHCAALDRTSESRFGSGASGRLRMNTKPAYRAYILEAIFKPLAAGNQFATLDGGFRRIGILAKGTQWCLQCIK